MYSPKRKLMFVNYTVLHGTSAAMKHFILKPSGLGLKWSTLNDWKKAIAMKTKKNYHTGQVEPITELEFKKQCRPALLSDKLSKEF